MNDKYFSIRTKVRKLRDRYNQLTVDEKIDLMKLELTLEDKNIKPSQCHTKSEKKSEKKKRAKIRNFNKKTR